MQNIHQSCDLDRSVRWSNVNAASSILCLLTLVAYGHDIKHGSAATWLFQALR